MKKLLKSLLPFIFILGLLLSAVTNSAAQTNRWTRLGTATNGSLLYFDNQSVKAVGENQLVWSKIVLPDNSYQIILLELHCGSNQFSVKDMTVYAEGGEFMGKKMPVSRATVVPDSVIEGFYQRICHSTADASQGIAVTADKRRIHASSDNVPTADSGASLQAKIIVPTTDVQVTPGRSAAVVRQASRGEQFVLLSKNQVDGWYQIRLSPAGDIGWLHGNTFKIIKSIAGNKTTRKLSKHRLSKRQSKS